MTGFEQQDNPLAALGQRPELLDGSEQRLADNIHGKLERTASRPARSFAGMRDRIGTQTGLASVWRNRWGRAREGWGKGSGAGRAREMPGPPPETQEVPTTLSVLDIQDIAPLGSAQP
jgi:hypothetical protein